MKRVLRSKEPVRLRDIAEEAGVAIPTVSQILNGHAREKRIRPETERDVRGIAKQMGYKTNLAAKSLVTKRSMAVGILVPNLGESYYPAIMAQLHRKVRQKGYLLIFANHYLDPKLFWEEIAALTQRSVDALLLGPVPRMPGGVRKIRELAGRYPVIAFDWADSEIDSIQNCPQSMGYAAADYIRSKGVRHVLEVAHLSKHDERLLGLPSHAGSRLRAFEERLAQQAGAKIRRTRWLLSNFEEGEHILRKSIESGKFESFDGMFFPQKSVAEFFAHELLQCGKNLSSYVAIVISGGTLHSYLRRSLSVLHQNPLDIADKIAVRLFARINDPTRPPVLVNLAAQLQERQFSVCHASL